MVKVKSRATIEANYRNSSSIAATRYRESISGVQWNQAAKDGQALYVQRMQDPEILSRREKGINKVSDSDFQKALLEKGAPVIGGRMSAAAGKMASGFDPYRTALESLTLPARTGDAMQNIDNRLKPVVQKMVDTKKAQS